MVQRNKGKITTVEDDKVRLADFTQKGHTFELGDEVRVDTTQGTRRFRCRARLLEVVANTEGVVLYVTVMVTRNISNPNRHTRYGHHRTLPPEEISKARG